MVEAESVLLLIKADEDTAMGLSEWPNTDFRLGMLWLR